MMKSTKMKAVALNLALLLVLCTPRPASPQWLVFDAAAFNAKMQEISTQLMQYIEQVETALNTYQTYYNTLKQLLQDAKHLITLPKEIVMDIVGPVIQLKQDLMDLANFGGEVQSFVDEFKNAYSSFEINGSGGSGNFENIASDVTQLKNNLSKWRQKIFEAGEKVAAMEATVTNEKLQEHDLAVTEVQKMISDAEGTLEAIQGVGQLNAVIASDMSMLRKSVQNMASAQAAKDMDETSEKALKEAAKKQFWNTDREFEFRF